MLVTATIGETWLGLNMVRLTCNFTPNSAYMFLDSVYTHVYDGNRAKHHSPALKDN